MALLRFLFAVLAITAAANAASVKGLGSPGAPITIEVFSDYQCPACKQLHDTTLSDVVKDYVKAGKVYIIHREFPLPMHQHALVAAGYAVAAYRLGKYEQVGDALFASQATWSQSGKVDEAATAGLTPADAKKLRALAQDASVKAEVQTEVEMGKAIRIGQTPTMMVTHKLKKTPISGYVTYAIFKKYLDDLLSK